MRDQFGIGRVARDDIAKEIVAFANAYGGVIIIGIDETDDHPKRAAQLGVILLLLPPTSSRLPPPIKHVGTPPGSHQRRHRAPEDAERKIRIPHDRRVNQDGN
jgi:predicted HTH transcriptional regulator